MTIRLRYHFCISLATLALAGCAGGGYSSNAYLMAPGQQVANIEQQRNMEGALAGCVLGGILGALVNDSRAMESAAIGCAAGGATGYVASEYINDQNAQYADAQYDAYEQEQVAASGADYYRQDTATVQDLIDEERRKIASLNAEYRANRISAEEYRWEVDMAQTNIDMVYSQLQDIEAMLAQVDAALAYNGTAASPKMVEQRNELAAERENLLRAAQELQLLYSREIPAEVRTGG